jgi:small-conductance mechanosensitive channel
MIDTRRWKLAATTGTALFALVFYSAQAQQAVSHPDVSPPSAPVELDGVELFQVRGGSQRGSRSSRSTYGLAANPAVGPNSVTTSDQIGEIRAGDQRIMVVTDEDARMEGVGRKVVAIAYADRLRNAIETYRVARSSAMLKRSAIYAATATAALALAVALLLWLWRRMHSALEQRYRTRIQSVGIQSFQLVRAERIWKVLQNTMGVLRAIVVLVLGFVALNYVLGLFPWTQGTATRLEGYVLEPLGIIGRGLLAQLPSVIFLAILFIVTRWTLKLVHLFFGAIGRGEVIFSGFDADWAEPTYLLRVLVMFALVVAYPISGSGSDAFKGITLFIGLMLTGSSSMIANIIAGYMMTVRRAFWVGDRVKIGDIVGDVSEIRVQVTHLRTPKNEEVIVPNSKILGDEVINYSSVARNEGLILHTTVGIGYETPWRQVEAMLLETARRTAGLMAEPPAFVLQKALGDFAITYG